MTVFINTTRKNVIHNNKTAHVIPYRTGDILISMSGLRTRCTVSTPMETFLDRKKYLQNKNERRRLDCR